MRYAVITPARDEAENIGRVHACLGAQSTRPLVWIVVDNGSTDGGDRIAHELAAGTVWMRVLAVEGERDATRGAPAVRSFNAGVEQLAKMKERPEVIVNVDADVSFAPDFFARLLAGFESDPRLGIAGGLCYELVDGAWRPQHVTRSHVRGAVRAYRAECLAEVGPLEPRVGWDSIDELRAESRGWNVRSFGDLPFHHHRRFGQRAGSWQVWTAEGDAAHYLGYRPSYLLLRTLYRMWREPAAAGMIWAFIRAHLRRTPRCPDPEVRRGLRRQQRARALPRRFREARGKV